MSEPLFHTAGFPALILVLTTPVSGNESREEGIARPLEIIDSNAVAGYINSSLLPDDFMPTLTIRNLPDHVHSALRVQAAQDGLSMEAEARKILYDACINPKKPVADLQELVDQLYSGKKPANTVEQLIRERRAEAENE